MWDISLPFPIISRAIPEVQQSLFYVRVVREKLHMPEHQLVSAGATAITITETRIFPTYYIQHDH